MEQSYLDTSLGQPTVKYLAQELHVSAHYLSDMLRELTCQSAQQHIHSALIERVKILLTNTNLSISEIAYQMGFEYPQSLNKLSRRKLHCRPPVLEIHSILIKMLSK